MANFALGLSALRTNQYALQVVSNNISNANTEGYHRQRIHLESLPSRRLGAHQIGTGVGVNYIERVRDAVTESSLTNSVSDLSQVDQLLLIEQQIESALMPGNRSASTELDQFFAELTGLTAAPDEPAQQSAVIAAGERVASVIRNSATQLGELKASVREQAEHEIYSLNLKMEELSSLSIKIKEVTIRGLQPHAELDRRDVLVNEIAEAVGVTRVDLFSEELNLMIGQSAIQQGSEATTFSLETFEDGELGVSLNGSRRPIELGAGRVSALLHSYNSLIPSYEEKLDTLAVGLMQGVDSLHSTGIGAAGSFQYLKSSRTVGDIDAPLADAGITLPVESGELTVTILDGDERRTEVVAIDVEVDTLRTLSAKLNAIDGLNSSVDEVANRIQIFGSSGREFNFTGRVNTTPVLDSYTGTSVPSFSGRYTGEQNQPLRFVVEGSGEVGISDNLFVNVFDENGAIQSRIDIGNGYEAGTEIDLGQGVDITFARGTVADGDEFATRLTAEPDETGVLAALGLNTFFRGESAASISIDATILQESSRFAVGRSGDNADTSNVIRIAGLRESTSLVSNQTLSEYIHEMHVEIGFQVSTDTAVRESVQSLQTQLQDQRDSVSAVDLNEEMVYLQQFQKGYEASVRIVQAVDGMLSDLFSIIR